MINYLGFGLILECFWVAVENEDFLRNVQKPIVSARKTRRVFFIAFCNFPHACYGFVQKGHFSSSENVGEIIAFFAHFYVHV